jgi:hypothetical protein
MADCLLQCFQIFVCFHFEWMNGENDVSICWYHVTLPSTWIIEYVYCRLIFLPDQKCHFGIGWYVIYMCVSKSKAAKRDIFSVVVLDTLLRTWRVQWKQLELYCILKSFTTYLPPLRLNIVMRGCNDFWKCHRMVGQWSSTWFVCFSLHKIALSHITQSNPREAGAGVVITTKYV